MSWIDQLHMYLKRLGYKVPLVPTQTIISMDTSRSVPTCDDSAYYSHLKTARLGMVGWNSWDFSFSNWDDCDPEDFHMIGGHRVKCEIGPGCIGGRPPVTATNIATDAAKSNVALISTWYNDHKAFRQFFKCFDGEELVKENTTQVSIPTLIALTREIHRINPNTWVLIMGSYPSTENFRVVDADLNWTRRMNMMVKEELEKEPRTLFVDYELPGGGLEMYDRLHWGHPNCRGAKHMVQAVLRRLYSGGVLARSIKLVDPEHNVANPFCLNLEGAACSTSTLCWLDPADQQCKAYSVGHTRFHRVPTSTITFTSTITTSMTTTTTTADGGIFSFWKR